MNVEFSSFLKKQKSLLKELVNKLSADFEYVSILGIDTKGTDYDVKKSGSSIAESSWSQRGFVARLYNGKGYSEYSFNKLNDIHETESAIRKIVEDDIALLKESTKFVEYPVIEDEKITETFIGEVKILPETVSAKMIIEKLTELMEKGLSQFDKLIDFRVNYQYVQTSKIFISEKKDLEQSYVWSGSYLFPIGRNEKGVKYTFHGFSGLKGVELLDELDDGIAPVIKEIEELLSAERVNPGEYDIICDPILTGLIAHEAFGHGVEMDMFVKNRAKAVEYMDKSVASSKVRMHDGAKSAKEVSSYLFDDEGTIGTDTMIIEDGILKSGISDLLSAMKLGMTPTGNGKRESFERKAYARMTNTYFAPGEDSLEDMISSIDRGYLLEGFDSGMEDPKNWGIQCVATKGTEIIDGKLTGNIIAPIYLTGYVPDLLQSITMVSDNMKLTGLGACGKGYKELVQTSIGGSYLKAKGRLA